MKLPINRKLKDYIYHQEGDSEHCSCTHLLFGDLMSRDCCYNYQDSNGEWHDWFGAGIYGGEMDFLLDYYVVGIHPSYKIENNRIVPYLNICLRKENK